MWFKALTGFQEGSAEQVRQNISIEGNTLKSHASGKAYIYGNLEIPSLGALRGQLTSIDHPEGQATLRELVADAKALHKDPSNENALFQVASQFNLLEMTSPQITPEHGIDRYETDPTQGPACAIAAGAGTVFRQYFVDLGSQHGQTEHCQVDCLKDLGTAWGNTDNRLWKMQNGYALATPAGLKEINILLGRANETTRDEWRQLLRIGVQWNTQVTLEGAEHTVSQAYCSALPVSYSPLPEQAWEPFARFVLEATYEACLCVGALNAARHHNNTVYLTLIGGGAFGNHISWIIAAIERAVKRYAHFPLDIAIVSHGQSRPEVEALVNSFNQKQ